MIKMQWVQKAFDKLRGKKKDIRNKKQYLIEGLSNHIICNTTETNKFLKKNDLLIKGNNNYFSVDDVNTIEHSRFNILGNNNKVVFSKGTGGIVTINIVADNCEVYINQDTGFTGTEIILWDNNSRVSIGADCIIARETRIYCTDFHGVIDYASKRPLNQGKFISIGNHVWIGEGVKILKNTNICDDVIIAAGSIVSKDLSVPHSVYVGIPALLKKENVSWVREKYDEAIAKFNATKAS